MSNMYGDVAIAARSELRARYFASPLGRRVRGWDSSDKEIRDHLTFWMKCEDFDRHNLLHDMQYNMVRRGYPGLMDSADVRL